MSLGAWISIILGIGVAGHAIVGVVLALPPGRLDALAARLWSPFGARAKLLRLNGLLLIIASVLHLGVSVWKWRGEGTGIVLVALPFLFFTWAGVEERRAALRRARHAVAQALGWVSFTLHAL